MGAWLRRWWASPSQFRQWNRWLSVGWLLLLCGLAFFWQLGGYGILDKDEAWYVEVSHQMVLRGDWLTPWWNGDYFFEKPPLTYWGSALGFSLLGLTSAAARLASAVWASALVVFGFFVLLRHGVTVTGVVEQQERQRWLSAWIGSGILALNPDWIAFGRTAVTDMPLAAPLGMGLLAVFVAWRQVQTGEVHKATGWWLAAFAWIAVATLAKGPVAPVLAVLIGVPWLLLTASWRAVFPRMPWLRGLLLFGAIALPWYLILTAQHGQDFLGNFFGQHNFQRFTDVPTAGERWKQGPWWFYLPVVVAGLAPWSVYLPWAIARLRFWRLSSWRQPGRQLALFCLLWFAVIFLFFSVSVTKLHSYILPAIPPLCILLALDWSERLVLGQSDLGYHLSAGGNILLLVLLAVASAIAPGLIDDPLYPKLPQLLYQSGLPQLSTVLWGLAALVGIVLLLRRQGLWLWLVNLAVLGSFLTAIAHPVLHLLDGKRQAPMRAIGTLVKQSAQPGEPVIVLGYKRTSAVFYSDHVIDFVEKPTELQAFLNQLRSHPQAPRSVLVWAPLPELAAAGLTERSGQLVGQAGTYRLLRLPVGSF